MLGRGLSYRKGKTRYTAMHNNFYFVEADDPETAVCTENLIRID
jgi:hypothetical protein